MATTSASQLLIEERYLQVFPSRKKHLGTSARSAGSKHSKAQAPRSSSASPSKSRDRGNSGVSFPQLDIWGGGGAWAQQASREPQEPQAVAGERQAAFLEAEAASEAEPSSVKKYADITQADQAAKPLVKVQSTPPTGVQRPRSVTLLELERAYGLDSRQEGAGIHRCTSAVKKAVVDDVTAALSPADYALLPSWNAEVEPAGVECKAASPAASSQSGQREEQTHPLYNLHRGKLELDATGAPQAAGEKAKAASDESTQMCAQVAEDFLDIFCKPSWSEKGVPLTGNVEQVRFARKTEPCQPELSEGAAAQGGKDDEQEHPAERPARLPNTGAISLQGFTSAWDILQQQNPSQAQESQDGGRGSQLRASAPFVTSSATAVLMQTEVQEKAAPAGRERDAGQADGEANLAELPTEPAGSKALAVPAESPPLAVETDKTESTTALAPVVQAREEPAMVGSERATMSKSLNGEDLLLEAWLPLAVCEVYHRKNVRRMYPWQVRVTTGNRPQRSSDCRQASFCCTSKSLRWNVPLKHMALNQRPTRETRMLING